MHEFVCHTEQFVAVTISIVSLSCSMTVVVINIHHCGLDGRPVPVWIKRLFFDRFGFLLCVGTQSLEPKVT